MITKSEPNSLIGDQQQESSLKMVNKYHESLHTMKIHEPYQNYLPLNTSVKSVQSSTCTMIGKIELNENSKNLIFWFQMIKHDVENVKFREIA